MALRYILINILLALPLFAIGQFSYVYDQSIEVQDENGNALPLEWSGGLNSDTPSEYRKTLSKGKNRTKR